MNVDRRTDDHESGLEVLVDRCRLYSLLEFNPAKAGCDQSISLAQTQGGFDEFFQYRLCKPRGKCLHGIANRLEDHLKTKIVPESPRGGGRVRPTQEWLPCYVDTFSVLPMCIWLQVITPSSIMEPPAATLLYSKSRHRKGTRRSPLLVPGTGQVASYRCGLGRRPAVPVDH